MGMYERKPWSVERTEYLRHGRSVLSTLHGFRPCPAQSFVHTLLLAYTGKRHCKPHRSMLLGEEVMIDAISGNEFRIRLVSRSFFVSSTEENSTSEGGEYSFSTPRSCKNLATSTNAGTPGLLRSAWRRSGDLEITFSTF
jgi:hypothetical protein